MSVSKKEIAAAYWAFEKPWQEYRKQTGDTRPASECGDLEIVLAAKKFLILMAAWEKDNPLPKNTRWVIAIPSGEPIPLRETWIG